MRGLGFFKGCAEINPLLASPGPVWDSNVVKKQRQTDSGLVWLSLKNGATKLPARHLYRLHLHVDVNIETVPVL